MIRITPSKVYSTDRSTQYFWCSVLIQKCNIHVGKHVNSEELSGYSLEGYNQMEKLQFPPFFVLWLFGTPSMKGSVQGCHKTSIPILIWSKSCRSNFYATFPVLSSLSSPPPLPPHWGNFSLREGNWMRYVILAAGLYKAIPLIYLLVCAIIPKDLWISDLSETCGKLGIAFSSYSDWDASIYVYFPVHSNKDKVHFRGWIYLSPFSCAN